MIVDRGAVHRRAGDVVLLAEHTGSRIFGRSAIGWSGPVKSRPLTKIVLPKGRAFADKPALPAIWICQKDQKQMIVDHARSLREGIALSCRNVDPFGSPASGPACDVQINASGAFLACSGAGRRRLPAPRCFRASSRGAGGDAGFFVAGSEDARRPPFRSCAMTFQAGSRQVEG